MRVLIACEFSGIVRNAFRAFGHDAWSCDLLPCEAGGPHYQFDARIAIRDAGPWDLMVAHPPCTFLANSGVRWLYGGKGTIRDEKRWADMEAGAKFFKTLLDAPVPMIAVENPIMHSYAREIVGRAPDQTIQPWQFGHGETKATCLWLKNVPALSPTRIMEERKPRVHFASPGPDRWKERSRTMHGIALAMAEQWGGKLQEVA